MSWKINKEKTEKLFLSVEDEDGWYKASVKWDGCIEFYRLFNVPLPITEEHPQSFDRIHFCDIDKEIERLQLLRDKAKEFFGETWPK